MIDIQDLSRGFGGVLSVLLPECEVDLDPGVLFDVLLEYVMGFGARV